jgi:isopenicillin N synthase-like dioxygenase
VLINFPRAFNFGEYVDGKAQQPIPETIVHDQAKISAFAGSCRKLSQKLLYLLGRGLNVSSFFFLPCFFTLKSHIVSSLLMFLTHNHIPPAQVDDFFSSAHISTKGSSDSTLRFLRYPPIDTTSHSAEDVRAGAHSDYGSITLLFRLRGQAGLELLRKDETWAPVPVCPPGTETDPTPPILINIGDLLSYWTNGLFRSTVHRVVFPTDGASSNAVQGETSSGARYSIAFFCHPVGTTALGPVPSERVKNFVAPGGNTESNPYTEKKVLTADEHLFMRLKASYGDLYQDKKS